MKAVAATRTQLRIQEAAMALFAETGAERLSVSELANAAGLARGTIYNNLDNPAVTVGDLAPIIREQLEADLSERLAEINDPLRRLSQILHLHAEKAHQEPVWCDFVMRYGYSEHQIRDFWRRGPMRELKRAAEQGAVTLGPSSPGVAAAAMGGYCLSMITLIRNGSRSWRQGAFEVSSLFLRSVGADQRAIPVAAMPAAEPLTPHRRTPLKQGNARRANSG